MTSVFMFRAGKLVHIGTSKAISTAAVIADPAEWYELFLDFSDEPSAFVETQLVVRPFDPMKWPSVQRRYTHEIVEREKTEPHTVFVAAVSKEEENKLFDEMVSARARRQEKICEHVRALKPAARRLVRWENLPTELKVLCRKTKLKPDECWVWRGNWKTAPYRRFYLRLKGPLPDGVILRHSCDNRRCLNPNHLTPGTHKQNTRDMMKRRRQPSQKGRLKGQVEALDDMKGLGWKGNLAAMRKGRHPGRQR